MASLEIKGLKEKWMISWESQIHQQVPDEEAPWQVGSGTVREDRSVVGHSLKKETCPCWNVSLMASLNGLVELSTYEQNNWLECRSHQDSSMDMPFILLIWNFLFNYCIPVNPVLHDFRLSLHLHRGTGQSVLGSRDTGCPAEKTSARGYEMDTGRTPFR